VLEHAEHPSHRGTLDDANASGYQMNPVCGDTLALQLRIDDGRIVAARFQAEGCTASLATSDIVAQLATGKSLDDAMALNHEDVSTAVGGLPLSKLHSAALAIDALRRAIASYGAECGT